MTQTLSHADSEVEVFVLPTSFAQQRLWFLQQLMPENPAYNVPLAVQLSGELDIAALEQTFNEIVRRHESLRTNFKMIEGQPRQIVLPQLTVPLPLIDLQNLRPADQQAEVERLTIEAFQHPFDLAQDALLRVKLLQLDQTTYVLLLTMHHIVTDGWSIAVLIRELEVLYIAFAAGHPSPLAELPIQYADFAHWQQDWLQGEVLASQLAYWQEKLEGAAPILELPNLREKNQSVVPAKLHFASSEKFQGAREALVLPKALKSAIAQLSDEANATPFMTLLAAFQTLLFRYTGQTDISVGSPIANRNHSELENLIGFFANSVVLRTNLSGNPTFLDLLNQVREVALGAYAHQDLPFEKLVEALQPDRNLNRNPLFQVVFALQNSPAESLELPKLTLSPVPIDPGTARFDLEFQIVECLDTLGVVAVYRTDLFDQAAIARMLKHFQTLLENIVAAPNQRISNLPILTAVEQHQQLVQWNATEAEYPKDWCIQDWFEAQVNQTPDAVAVVFADQQLTYRELSDLSNQLAHSLQQFGVVPDRLVGICVERSLNMLIAVLAVLKAGGAYVPLDPTYPTERLQFMLQDAQVSILLTQRSLVDRFEGQTAICLDQQEYQPSSNPPLSRVTANNLAYVIHTSGSTGQPKGVLVTHQGLSNLAQAQHQIFNVQPSDRVLQFASLSFDASIFEIIMALTTGATLYLTKSESRLGANLVQFLQEQQITHVTLPPALLNLLPDLPNLKVVIAAGEACSSELVDRWAMRHRFFNAYGLTETSVWSTIAELKVGQPVTIGRAIANTQLYVLNSDLQPVAIGVPGELYIGGDGLAKGYLNRHDLTAERFIANPFKPDSRLYKTGDRVRYRSDGNLQFLGRVDEQVKLRGYRIELGEIEAVLKQHPAIKAAVVAVQVAEKTIEEKHIVACVVPNSTATPELNSQLKAFLQQRLPAYMIPSVIAIQPTLPLLPNGKIDRQSLATLSLNPAAVAPRTETEVTLTKLWAEQLGLTEIDVTQNFFDMGGDSLKAMRLMEQIGQHFERSLPLSSLFLAPTIEQLAQQLDQANCSTSASEISGLVPLQPAGSKPPFFCVHPIFGTVFPYYQLAQQFSAPTDSAKQTSVAQSTVELSTANRPFYGLHPIGLEGHPPHTTIEEMAAYYIKAIRQIQPQGPYYIGGWSFGGVVAFEMAQQLEQAGHEVALLAMLDTASPGHQLSYRDNFNVLATLTRSLLPFLIDYGCLLKSSLQTQGTQFLSSFLKSFRRQPRSDNELRPANSADVWHSQSQLLNELSLRPILQTYRANAEAFLSYSPQWYSRRVTLFKTSKTDQNSTLGWEKLTKEVNLCPIPGNHLTMLRSPHVQYLAQQLKQCMEKGK